MTDTLNLIPTVSLRGKSGSNNSNNSNTILDYSDIGNKPATIVMARGSTLTDITISGSASNVSLPSEFTQKLKAADDVVIERISLENLAYGIETSDTTGVKLIDIHCKNIKSKQDWGACIHVGGLQTSDLNVNGFTAINCNRGVEIDAPASDIIVENGYLENIRNFEATGQTAFSIDVHSHSREGGNSDIIYRNIYLKNTDAPSAYAVGSQEYIVSDQPRNVLFENITVENPDNPWYVNAQEITIKNSMIIGSTNNIIVILKNSRDVTIDNVETTELHTDKFFVSNSEFHTGVRQIQSGIEDVKVLNSRVKVSEDKNAVGEVISLHDIDGVTLEGNTIINAKKIPAIGLADVTRLEEENNDIVFSN